VTEGEWAVHVACRGVEEKLIEYWRGNFGEKNKV